MLYSFPAITFFRIPVRSCWSILKVRIASVWIGDWEAMAPEAKFDVPVQSRLLQAVGRFDSCYKLSPDSTAVILQAVTSFDSCYVLLPAMTAIMSCRQL